MWLNLQDIGMKKKLVSLLLLTLVMSLVGCGDSTGKIGEINQSPTGKYQVDEVNWSGGATAGESYLVIEAPVNGVF